MTTAFGSPSSYVQGKGVLNHADEHLHVFGHRPLVLAGGTAYRLVGEDLIFFTCKNMIINRCTSHLTVNHRITKLIGSPKLVAMKK
nr:hypothetical protein [Limosilactobacillus equigenerosi]